MAIKICISCSTIVSMFCNQIAIVILFIELALSDKYQVVHRGPCLTKPDFYCHSKVQNSYCSKQNNECFCQSDFVTVRERSGVKCKPCKWLNIVRC